MDIVHRRTEMNSKLIIVALLAFAVGGSCPSDVDNDGNVGILDLLQVLSSWGPCPAAVLIDVATTPATALCADGNAAITVRQWSDGFAEYRVEDNDCGSIQPGWAPMPASLTPPMTRFVPR